MKVSYYCKMVEEHETFCISQFIILGGNNKGKRGYKRKLKYGSRERTHAAREDKTVLF